MKTLLLQISLIIFSLITNAQSWCPAGAEWHYRHSSANSNGFVKLKQTNTVTLQGTSCQQITQTFSVFNSLISSSPTTYSNAIFTTFSNNVVYYYTAQPPNYFDTLYNFGATIGNKWKMPNSTSTLCVNPMITVVDTGHKLIQSVNLKWLKISFPTVTSPTSAIVFKTDTIFERLGSVNYYLIDENSYCPAQTYDAGRTGSLRCYSDNQIINYKRVSTTCDYIFIPGPPSSLNSYLINTLDVKVFPNPTAEKLIMLLENNTKQKYQISLQNNLGQIVLQKQFEPTSNELELDVKDLPKGIYFLKLTSANNQSFTQKIIKE